MIKPAITIRPSSFQTTTHWVGTFDNYERETSARLLVKYCQQPKFKDEWPAVISKPDLDKWAEEDFWFNGLDSEGYIKVTGNKVMLTNKFVAQAYAHQ